MTQPNDPTPEDRSGEFAAGSAADQPAATPQWPSQPGAEPAFAAPAPPAYGPFPKTSNNAIAALILSIVAWVVCPIIPAIIALVLAKQSGDEIAASGGRVGGEGLNTASKIVSWINIGFYAALIVFFGAIFLIAIVAGAASGA